MNDQDYIKGFNEGYLIAQHLPELAERIAKAEGVVQPRLAGFRDGQRQCVFDQNKEAMRKTKLALDRFGGHLSQDLHRDLDKIKKQR